MVLVYILAVTVSDAITLSIEHAHMANVYLWIVVCYGIYVLIRGVNTLMS
jgi:hypothetical protein